MFFFYKFYFISGVPPGTAYNNHEMLIDSLQKPTNEKLCLGRPLHLDASLISFTSGHVTEA